MTAPKQPPVFYNKSCCWEFHNIHRKIPVLESVFSKELYCNFMKRRHQHRCFLVNMIFTTINIKQYFNKEKCCQSSSINVNFIEKIQLNWLKKTNLWTFTRVSRSHSFFLLGLVLKYLASLVILIFLPKTFIWNKIMFRLTILLNLAEVVVNELMKNISKRFYQYLFSTRLIIV